MRFLDTVAYCLLGSSIAFAIEVKPLEEYFPDGVPAEVQQKLDNKKPINVDPMNSANGPAAVESSLKTGESTAQKGVDHPQFTPFPKVDSDAFLWEQFIDDNAKLASRWKASSARNPEGKGEEFAYVGKWSFEEATVFPGFKNDKGLVVKSPAARHAISAKLNKPLDNAGKTLVVQYEVKLQNGLECGGAYLKLLNENEALHAEEFSNETPYQVMFGPDKCGSTNKIHFIVRRKNPNTGEYEERHLVAPPAARLNKLTNLYTLIIHPNQEYEIRVNGEVARAGSMVEEGAFSPGFNPAKEIEDEDDVKPSTWIDEKYIPDPSQAEKPADWDEDAPFQIPDPEAVKPEDWQDDEEPFIADADAEKPEDWDDEEDGEWIAPEIPNPACETAGCGPWEAPLIRNPNYKGKWTQPTMENPAYIGEWTPRMIANPDYYEDASPSNLEPIGAVGFELWTMQNDILFDNIYIGHSVESAELAGNNTFAPKLLLESQEEKSRAPEPLKDAKKGYESAMEFFQDDPMGYMIEVFRVFILNVSIDPKRAIINQPVAAAATGFAGLFALVIAIGIIQMIISLFAPSPVSGKKPEKTEKSEKSEDSAQSSSVSSATSTTKRKT
jgi:calnexin